MKDYYSILGISRDATQKDIKKAFRSLAKKYHPDQNGADDAASRFKEINEAFSVLSDPQKRSQYDQVGYDGSRADGGGFQGFQGPGGFNSQDPFGGLGSIFESMFGGGFNYAENVQRNTRGSDLSLKVNLSFNDAVFGCEKEVGYVKKESCDVCEGTGSADGKKSACSVCKGSGRQKKTVRTPFGTVATETVCSNCKGAGEEISNPCSNCNSSGRVTRSTSTRIKIPAGVENGMRMRFAGKGDAGVQGGNSGDLYVTFAVEDHKHFKVENGDVFLNIKIDPSSAVLGDEIEIPTVNGEIRLKIPKGTQGGKQFRLKGKGAPKINGGVGDQYVTVQIDIPTRISSEEKALWESLKGMQRSESLLDRIFK